MNNRDPVVEEKQPMLKGMLNALDNATQKALGVTMATVIGVVEGGNKGPTREQQIKEVQDLQLGVILILLLQFILALILIGVFILLDAIEDLFDKVAFIVQLVLLVVFLMSLAVAHFAGSTVHVNPKNVVLFIVHLLIRMFWFAYLTVTVQIIKFELIILIFTVDIILILIFFRWDMSDKINNCFKIRDQPWRISFIIIIQILILGLVLPIEDMQTAIIWLLILIGIYFFILLDIQLVEFRRFFRIHQNDWLLGCVMFDSDVIFPCFLISSHCGLQSHQRILD